MQDSHNEDIANRKVASVLAQSLIRQREKLERMTHDYVPPPSILLFKDTLLEEAEELTSLYNLCNVCYDVLREDYTCTYPPKVKLERCPGGECTYCPHSLQKRVCDNCESKRIATHPEGVQVPTEAVSEGEVITKTPCRDCAGNGYITNGPDQGNDIECITCGGTGIDQPTYMEHDHNE